MPAATAVMERRRVVETGPQNLEQTRYVFFPGNLIDPVRARELSDMIKYRVGGTEVNSPCLRAVEHWDNFVGRCRITPVLVFAEPLPTQMMAEGARPVVLDRSPSPIADGGSTDFAFGAGMGPMRTSLGVKCYPGEHMDYITDRSEPEDRTRGIKELQSLYKAGIEWEQFEAMGIQEVFFPNLLALPKTLREVEDMTDAALVGKDRLLIAIQGEMRQSCAIFRLWATHHLDKRDALVQKGVNDQGHSDRYTGTDLVLLEQLERERLDAYAKSQARSQGTLVNVMQQMAENQAKQDERDRQQAEQNQRMNEMIMQNQKLIAEKLSVGYPAQVVTTENAKPTVPPPLPAKK